MALAVLRPMLALALAAGVARGQTLFDSYAVPGPHAAGWDEVALASAAEGPPLPVRLDYPAERAGGGAPPDQAGGPWPLLVFGHGTGAAPAVYEAWLALLASWGLVVVSPQTALEGPLDPLAADLGAALDAALLASGASTGPLAGLVDGERLALAGHSLGGGAAVVAAAARPDLDAVVALSPWDAPPELAAVPPSVAAASLQAPLLVVVGSEDTITPPADDAGPIYEAAQSVARLRELVVVPGAGHAGPQVLFDVAADAGVAFLRACLIDEHPALDHVYGPLAQSARDRELTYEVRAPDCFLTGTLAPGEVFSVHLSGAAGAPVWLALGPAPAADAGACPGLAPAGASFFGMGTLGPGQVASLDVPLPEDLLLPPGVSLFLQTLEEGAGAPSCSPVRELVTP